MTAHSKIWSFHKQQQHLWFNRWLICNYLMVGCSLSSILSCMLFKHVWSFMAAIQLVDMAIVLCPIVWLVNTGVVLGATFWLVNIDKGLCSTFPLTFLKSTTSHLFADFLCPGLKGPLGASSVWIVRLSVCPSVRLCVIPSRLQTKCNILSLGGHTVTKLGL